MSFPPPFIPPEETWPSVAAKLEISQGQLVDLFEGRRPTCLKELYNLVRASGSLLAVHMQDASPDVVALTPDAFLVEVGNELKTYRTFNEYSIAQVAKASGIPAEIIKQLERGKLDADIELVRRLCGTYQMALIFLPVKP